MNLVLRRIRLFTEGVWLHNISYADELSFIRGRNQHTTPNTASEEPRNIINTYGQPTPKSHPHILKPKELVPGFTVEDIYERRHRLIESIRLSNAKSPHVVLIPSANVQFMTEKIPYVFRQNSDFRYLTGCLEPDSVLLIFIDSNSSETTLFVREKSSHSELWEGHRTGSELAPEFFRVDKSKPINNLASELSIINKSVGKFSFWYDFHSPVNDFVQKAVTKFLIENGIKDVISVKSKIHHLRLLKSFKEQQLLKESAEIASRAIDKAMSISRPGLTEHQLFATVDYYCRMNKAEHLAYPPVVAAGNNANIIHYIENTQEIKDGDMVLMDAGCELHGYCSDITRTWPISGKFSEPQRTLYEIVLKTQLDLIANCHQKPLTLNQLFDFMCTMLGRYLKEAHVLTELGNSTKLEALGYKLCPHHVGHYLGMDVHDTSTVQRDIPLKEGMLITIEPGLYIPLGCKLTKPEFHGMGIRIEDDVLITENGAEVISNALKHPDEVESLCRTSTT